MIYLGPSRPMTSLSTWEELVNAAEGHLLAENAWCELKETIGPPNKATNTELARDLAALAAYGGVLIVGVNNSEEVVGTDISGMRERISQVAATKVQPPLTPHIHGPIEGPDGKSVLLVSVAPSPVRPHMVDGAYWGRSSHGKRQLGDEEVRTLMMESDRGEEAFRDRLLGMVVTDPLIDLVGGHPTGQGYIYLLAQPCSPVPKMGDDVDVQSLARGLPHSNSNWDGHVGTCDQRGYDPEGRAFMSRRTEVQPDYERYLCFISVKDRDSSVEIVSGGGTARWEHRDGTVEDFVLAGLTATLTIQMLEFVQSLSLATGYFGLWRFGVHITNLRGKNLNTTQFSPYLPGFGADAYTQTTVTSVSGLDDTEAVLLDLLRGFLRGLGVETWSLQNVMAGV